MTKQQYRKIEDIRTSEILGEKYRKNHPKKNKKSLNSQKSNIIIIIVLIVIILLFCIGHKLNLGNSKFLIYLNHSLLKYKFNNVKDFIKNLFNRQKKYVTN